MKIPNPMLLPGGQRPRSKDFRGNNRSALCRMGKTNVCPSKNCADGHVLWPFAHPTSLDQFPKKISFYSLLALIVSVAVSPPTLAQSSPINYPPGLCYQGQRDISGSWVNDGTGELVPLTALCEVAIQHQETINIPPIETSFWQAFITAASPEALEFANASEVEDVIAYGQTICPSLHELGTMHELRMTQAEGGLPASFDAAVNVAAIHTYCPEKARSIGR